MANGDSSSTTALLGNPMAPETFIEPVADQTLRDMEPRIINMFSSFLKETLSALIGRFFTGFDSDQKAPPVPTYIGEAAAEEAAKVAELVGSLAEEEGYKAGYDAAIAAGIAAEAGAYAAAVGKAAGFKAQVPAKLAAFKMLYTMSMIEEAMKKNTSDNTTIPMPPTPTKIKNKLKYCMDHPHVHTKEIDCFRIGMEEISRKFRYKVDDALFKADQAARKGRRCKIVSKQSSKTVDHHKKLAKKIKKNIANTFEYRYLDLVHVVIETATNATKSAKECSIEYKKLALQRAKTANIILNVTKKLKKDFRENNLPTEGLEKHFPSNNNETENTLNDTMAFIEMTDTDTMVVVDSAKSREVLSAFVEESFMNHQMSTSRVRIRSDQWDELRVTGDPKRPKSPLGYTQKQIVFKLSHSLTTELSEQLTRSLTTHLTNYLNLVLSDAVNEKAPNLAGKEVIRMVVPGISNAISYTSTVVMLRLLPLFLTSALDNVLTNTLTKAITHTLSSSLTHTLKYSPDQESLCYNCRALNKDCDKCRVSWKAEETAEFYLNHDASYFSDYYSLYYTGVGNPRP
jgi:hypothetical protein